MISSPFAEWKFLAHVVVVVPIVAISMYGTWYVTSDHYQKIIAQQQVKEDESARMELKNAIQVNAQH